MNKVISPIIVYYFFHEKKYCGFMLLYKKKCFINRILFCVLEDYIELLSIWKLNWLTCSILPIIQFFSFMASPKKCYLSKVNKWLTFREPYLVWSNGIEVRKKTTKTKSMLGVAEIRNLRTIPGKTRRPIWNTDIRQQCGIQVVIRWGRQKKGQTSQTINWTEWIGRFISSWTK